MRELTSHKVYGLNEALEIQVLDEPGQGNACHRYLLTDKFGVFAKTGEPQSGRINVLVEFQSGPIQETGVNGVSNESLLAIVEDRLLGFQSGEFACRENALALTKLQEALMWLHKRTRDRVSRGVEGTNDQ